MELWGGGGGGGRIIKTVNTSAVHLLLKRGGGGLTFEGGVFSGEYGIYMYKRHKSWSQKFFF